MFDFLKKKKKKDQQLHTTNEIIKNQIVSQTTKQAGKHFYKPDYNQETRKQYYDNGIRHKEVKDSAFLDNEVLKDPYSNQQLYKTKKEAKMNLGSNYQKGLANADHKVPLNKLVKKSKEGTFTNAYITSDDIRNIGNDYDNFQVISAESNQTAGKGGMTQQEWSGNKERMTHLSEESGKSVEEISEYTYQVGETAEKSINKKLLKTGVKNMFGTAHAAGKEGAKGSATVAATISGINNVVACINGEKSLAEASKDVGGDIANGAVSGYVSVAMETTINHTLTSTNHEFLQILGENNVPGKIITTVSITGDTVVRWTNGDITTEECLEELGDKGCSFAGSGIGAGIGQTLIPIPIVGATIGSMVGGAVTGGVYRSIMDEMHKLGEEERRKQEEMYQKMVAYYMEQQRRVEVRELVHVNTEIAVENSLHIIMHSEEFQRLVQEGREYISDTIESRRRVAECVLVTLQLEEYRRQLQDYVDRYFARYRCNFDEAFNFMNLCLEVGDYDGAIIGNNQVISMFGKEPTIKSVDDFKNKVLHGGKISF